MPSKRETFIRDRKHNCASRKRTHRERMEHLQKVAATLRRLEAADANDKVTR